MKMRKPPKTETIHKNINRYAYNAGFLYSQENDGTVRLFDMTANYWVFRGSKDRAVQMVVDDLWAKYFRLHPSK
jgi:hypothetical protein